MISVLGLLIARIYYVNKHARLPEINTVVVGDTLFYEGYNYTVLDAVMYGFDEYNNQFFDGSLTDNRTDDDCKVILVSMRLDKVEADKTFSPSGYIEYGDIANEFDIFTFPDLNPTLADGTFRSGDTIYLAYEIYKENMSAQMWGDVLHLPYRIVFGSYPVKNCMELGDIREE